MFQMLKRSYINTTFKFSYDDALNRITHMIRGIGDPLVATYARCYLVRVGVHLTSNKTYIQHNFKDFLNIYQMVTN